jgi:hypothetical protein
VVMIIPGVWAVLESRESDGMTRTPVCFHASSGGPVGGSVNVGVAILRQSNFLLYRAT